MNLNHFKAKDFACRCGCGQLPSDDIMALADMIREEWGRPLNCTSGARCLKHTMHLRATGTPAALKSSHISGEAVDLAPVSGKDIEEFQQFCVKNLERWGLWMEEPSQTPSWAHLQTRPARKRIFKP